VEKNPLSFARKTYCSSAYTRGYTCIEKFNGKKLKQGQIKYVENMANRFEQIFTVFTFTINGTFFLLIPESVAQAEYLYLKGSRK
jgi:hypothetical protein